uniref:Putative LOC100813409 [Glycine max] n=1 Tax=Lepeophtheirus salmonis TaxID=72036 RepID=A0A0K2TL44_LEPSM
MSSTNTENIIKKLKENWFSSFGYPRIITTLLDLRTIVKSGMNVSPAELVFGEEICSTRALLLNDIEIKSKFNTLHNLKNDSYTHN